MQDMIEQIVTDCRAAARPSATIVRLAAMILTLTLYFVHKRGYLKLVSRLSMSRNRQLRLFGRFSGLWSTLLITIFAKKYLCRNAPQTQPCSNSNSSLTSLFTFRRPPSKRLIQ
eukprot:6178770-Pleurochrysis_carterae.AAC.1